MREATKNQNGAQSRVAVHEGKGQSHSFWPPGQPMQRVKAAGRFLAEEKQEGKETPDTFLPRLQKEIFSTADAMLAEIDQSATDCPYLSSWFSYYAGKDAAHIEQAIARFAPATLGARDVGEMISFVVARVAEGLKKHILTGSVDDVPAEIKTDNPAPTDFLHIAQQQSGDVAQLSCLKPQSSDSGQKKNPQKRNNSGDGIMIEVRPKKNDEVTDEDRDQAKMVFRKAQVLNMTNVTHHVGENAQWGGILGDQLQSITRRDAPLDHVVNKWERAEKGEILENYMQGESDGALMEAVVLGVSVEAYKKLASRERMQFGLLDYKFNPGQWKGGFGRSYFVINKQKLNSDAFIHLGDSGEKMFNRQKGPYKNFEEQLDRDDELVRILTGKENYGSWIEVNIGGGVNLPDDIDRFVVDRAELGTLKGKIQGKKQEEVTLDDLIHDLGKVYGEKLIVE